MRLVTQALFDFRRDAVAIFAAESDLVADVGEDISREALDRVGVSRIPTRLIGKMDYKRARYVFQPDYSLRQALFVDSKAERDYRTATIQTAQSSMRIRQIRRGQVVDEPVGLPEILEREGTGYLTTTVFVQYYYEPVAQADAQAAGDELENALAQRAQQLAEPMRNRLQLITIAALPNGMLQDRYNPNATDTIWIAGRNAPTRGEAFRVRLSFEKLEAKASWRVQRIRLRPTDEFVWRD